ncbi:MAG: NADH:ubiquinone reductase (Na(+)-transporting) subunit A, partial [Bacteroidota bacterium]
YAIIANPEDKPKSIFISGFDSAPLAPDYNLLISGQEKVFQTGIDVLKKLTDGKVHLTLNGRTTPEAVFSNAAGVQINKISGPHPAGCVGIQIHHIDPINKNDIVWTVNPMDVARIGKLFTEGKYDAQKIVALAGPGVKEPQYYRTMTGACIEDMVSGNVIDEELRYISGNPLTGSRIAKKGFLGFYHYQVSVLEEGIKPLFFGWGMPRLKRFSVSRSFLSWLMSKKQFNITTNYHGRHRAYVVTGQYEKVLPIDILPVYLMKSIIVKDIDKMEALGIYEVAEEDLALCEFVCTSKIEVQSIVREGIDLMIKELS